MTIIQPFLGFFVRAKKNLEPSKIRMYFYSLGKKERTVQRVAKFQGTNTSLNSLRTLLFKLHLIFEAEKCVFRIKVIQSKIENKKS